MATLKPGQPTDDIPHDIHHPEFNPRPAFNLAPGVTLLTLDGRRIGNAIIVKDLGRTPISEDPVWLIETDFGNQIQKKASEICELWSLGFEQSYETWKRCKLDLQFENWVSGIPPRE